MPGSETAVHPGDIVLADAVVSSSTGAEFARIPPGVRRSQARVMATHKVPHHRSPAATAPDVQTRGTAAGKSHQS